MLLGLCFCFFAKTITWLPPYLFGTVPQSNLRNCLPFHGIQYNSQLLGCALFSVNNVCIKKPKPILLNNLKHFESESPFRSFTVPSMFSSWEDKSIILWPSCSKNDSHDTWKISKRKKFTEIPFELAWSDVSLSLFFFPLHEPRWAGWGRLWVTQRLGDITHAFRLPVPSLVHHYTWDERGFRI